MATVISMASADSHDAHIFVTPDQMIRGPVSDPQLTLNNHEISRRHVTAYLLQRYHQARLEDGSSDMNANLFEVLGTVEDFLRDDTPLNTTDFFGWLSEHESSLAMEVGSWLPEPLDDASRLELTSELARKTIDVIDGALNPENDLGAT